MRMRGRYSEKFANGPFVFRGHNANSIGSLQPRNTIAYKKTAQNEDVSFHSVDPVANK